MSWWEVSSFSQRKSKSLHTHKWLSWKGLRKSSLSSVHHIVDAKEKRYHFYNIIGIIFCKTVAYINFFQFSFGLINIFEEGICMKKLSHSSNRNLLLKNLHLMHFSLLTFLKRVMQKYNSENANQGIFLNKLAILLVIENFPCKNTWKRWICAKMCRASEATRAAALKNYKEKKREKGGRKVKTPKTIIGGNGNERFSMKKSAKIGETVYLNMRAHS